MRCLMEPPLEYNSRNTRLRPSSSSYVYCSLQQHLSSKTPLFLLQHNFFSLYKGRVWDSMLFAMTRVTAKRSLHDTGVPLRNSFAIRVSFVIRFPRWSTSAVHCSQFAKQTRWVCFVQFHSLGSVQLQEMGDVTDVTAQNALVSKVFTQMGWSGSYKGQLTILV